MAKVKPDQWIDTKIKYHPFSFGWSISGCSALFGQFSLYTGELDEDYFESPIATSDLGHQWSLSMSPTRNATNLGIFLTYCGKATPTTGTGDATSKVRTLYKLRLLDANNREFIPTEFATGHELKVAEFEGGRNKRSGYNDFMRMQELVGSVGKERGLLQDDTLRIFCSLAVEEVLSEATGTGTVRNLAEEENAAKLDGLDNLTCDLGKLLVFPDLEPVADVTLMVGNSPLRCHKFMLCARSDVFRKMFSSGMTESATGMVAINGFSAEVVQMMLDYIYTGQVRNWDGTGTGLLAIGEQYLILSLKTAAEKFLVNDISVKNAAELLVLGSLFGAPDLKKAAEDFILQNKKDVIETDGFRQMMKTNPAVVAELFIA